MELLVALAVFATLAAAVLSAAQWGVLSQQRLEARWFASIALDNHVQAVRLGLVPAGIESAPLTFGHYRWWLEQRTQAAGQLSVQVREARDGQALARWTGSAHAQ